MGVMLLLTTVLAQGLSPGPIALGPDAKPEITALELHLPAHADPKLLDKISGLITVRKGQKVSARAVQRSIENLYATGRFSDVVVRSVTLAIDTVELIFELTPKQVVSDVYVEGNVALTTSELLALIRVSAGSEFWPERAAQTAEVVHDIYRRRGYLDASVVPQVTETEEGVSLGLSIREGQPTRVTAIAFAGEPGLSPEQAREVIQISPGDVLDLDRLEHSVDALRIRLRADRYFRARVEAPVVTGARVVIPVVSGPRYELVFSGNRRISDTALKAVLAYDGEESLDALVEQRLARKLQLFYRYRGFHDVRVTAREARRPSDRTAALGFEIVEGDPIRVVALKFLGNTVITDRELRDVLLRVMEASSPTTPTEAHPMGDPLDVEGRMAPIYARELPTPPLDTVLDENAFAEAAKAMTALYRERGYFGAVARLDHIDLEHGQASAAFVIEESVQALFRRVETSGLPVAFHSDTVAIARDRVPFSSAALERVRSELIHELGRRGYLFATVQASYALADKGTHADCRLQVTAGPQVRVRKILAVGNKRTHDDLILAQAMMTEGLPLDVDTLYSTQSNLLALGIFKLVEVEVLAAETPEPLKTVLLKVHEQARVAELGLGYFSADGVTGFLDLGYPNVAGRAINLSGHLQLNYFLTSVPVLSRQVDVSRLASYELLGGRGNFSAQNRGILPFQIGMRLDLVGERVFRPLFNFTRFAAVPSFDWSRAFEIPGVDWVRPKITLLLQNEIEWSSVLPTGSASASATVNSAINFVDQARLRFLFGRFGLETIRFAPTLDLRDSALNPHVGLVLQGAVEVTTAIATEDLDHQKVPVSFLKAAGLATVYVPISKTVLAVSARGGRIFSLIGDKSTTPPVKRFFLGGSTSMRGFNEDQLVAEDQRQRYHREVEACQVLAAKDGCSSAATTIGTGRQVPSQGGEFFGVFKAELRFPAFSGFDLAVFAEAGNLYLDLPAGPFAFRYIVGVGLRYVTPIGPLAFDVGINPGFDAVINEPPVVVHFNIGVF